MSEVTDWALAYIALGFRVIELAGPSAGGKRPRSPNWQVAGQTDPLTWAPSANVGLVCGPASGLVVLDVDGVSGQASLAELEAAYGPLPPGPKQVTGSGGLHILFAFTEAVAHLTNRVGIRPGLDLRTTGGQIVVCPSVHASGGSYEWMTLPDAPLPEMPPWLVSLAEVRAPGTRAELTDYRETMDFASWLDAQDGAISGEGGSQVLIRIARVAVRKAHMTSGEAFAAIVEPSNWNRNKCKPPWTHEECVKKFDDALTRWHEEGRVAIPCDKKGQRYQTHMDLRRIVREDPEFGGRLQTNELGMVMEYDRVPLTDARLLQLRTRICERYDYRDLSVDRVREVVTEECEANRYNPVVAYLDTLEWDGQGRLDYIAPQILGSTSAAGAQMVRKWCIGAVARAYVPGCEMRNMLILCGEQYVGKGTFFRILGGEWFIETAIEVGNKDGYQQIERGWIIEWQELEALYRAKEIQSVKAFISSREDTYRRAYGRLTETNKRRCVFGGSANTPDFLYDRSGSHRFWPIEVPGVVDHPFIPGQRAIDRDTLIDWRDQIWAEAKAAYLAGEEWRLEGEAETARADEAAGYQPDAPIYELARLESAKWPDTWITFADACKRLNVVAEQCTPLVCKEIGAGLQASGYKKKRRQVDGQYRHGYERKATV